MKRTKNRAHSHTKAASYKSPVSSKSRSKGIVGAAAEAAQEIGLAAGAFKEGWDHAQEARAKGQKALRPFKQGAKKAVRAAKRLVSRKK